MDTVFSQAGTDRVVFTLMVNTNGSWTFDLMISSTMWPPAATMASNDIAWRRGRGPVDRLLQDPHGTDFDGDTVTGATAGKFAITIENDVPIAANDFDLHRSPRVCNRQCHHRK